MTTYQISNSGKVQKLDLGGFPNEASLHKFFEDNLYEILELRRISHKYKVNNLDNNRDEIDTLAVDDLNRPVIIEYKQGQAPDDVMAQIGAYKAHLRNQKRFVDRDAMESCKVALDWSGGIQVFLVAEGFSKDIRAIAAAGELTLVTYSLHKLGATQILGIEWSRKDRKKGKSHRSPTSSDTQSMSSISPVEPYEIQRYLEKTKPEFSVPFEVLRTQINQLDGIEEVIQPKIGITYKTLKAVVRFEFKKNSIDVLLKSGASQGDNEKRLRDITGHQWGFPWLFKIEKPDDFEYALQLFQAAYESMR